MILRVLLYLLLSCSLSAGQRGPLPPDLPVLQLRYPNTPWVSPGDTLLMRDTQPVPQISSRGFNQNLTYILLFIDLDVIWESSKSTVILHWYQPDMMSRQLNERLYLLGYGENGHRDALVNITFGAEYIAPQPPPNTNHRYVYFLFEQREGYEFPECFGYIFPKTGEARAGFDAHQFIEVAGLSPPVAGNYFFVKNNGPLTGTGTSTTSRTSPTTTWLRSAPCSQGVTATPTGPVDSGACEVDGKRQVVM